MLPTHQGFNAHQFTGLQINLGLVMQSQLLLLYSAPQIILQQQWVSGVMLQPSLDEFNRRYPSGIDLEELAIVNQVDGAGTRLPAGALVKRVASGSR